MENNNIQLSLMVLLILIVSCANADVVTNTIPVIHFRVCSITSQIQAMRSDGTRS